MIVLDTNVISELMRPTPDAAVFAWVEAQPRSVLYVTTITQAEILAGIAVMPHGRRRDALVDVGQEMFATEFAGRVLPFGANAAVRYAEIVAARRSSGHPLQGFDGLIAAIAGAAGAHVATRNITDFEGCGVTVMNPWDTA